MKALVGLIIVAGAVSPHLVEAANLSKSDMKFMTESAQGLMSEVKLGELAQQRALDERVKDFGKQMVADHGKDLRELQPLFNLEEREAA